MSLLLLHLTVLKMIDVPDNALISSMCFRELVLVEDFVLSRFFGFGSGFRE